MKMSKKVLSIILSLAMMMVMAIPAFCYDQASAYAPYDRAKVQANDKETIDSLNLDQIAGIVLDWVDRKIAKEAAGFESFEVEVYGQSVAVDIPEISRLDDIMQYANYLSALEGDFAKLQGTDELASLSRDGGDINFIYGILEFMALNSDLFGKVFRWDENVFDYGKVGKYILALDPEVGNNQKIIDFYSNYLIGNDIQDWFISGVAQEMDYEIPRDADGKRTETFDETISNGIITWFAGLCEQSGILSEAGLAELKAYDLRTSDIYTHIKNFVALVQSDNQVKIDTYYNYLLDTTVRTLLKTMLGQKPVVGEEVADAAAVKAEFSEKYSDLAALYELSAGNVYFKAADGAYYAVTVTADEITSVKTLTWEDALDINFEPPVVNMYTGAALDTLVQQYKPNNENFTIGTYSSEKNQNTINSASPDSGITFTGTEIPEAATAVMVDANAKTLTDGVKIETIMGDQTTALTLTFAEIEKYAEEEALKVAKPLVENMAAGMNLPLIGTPDITVEAIDVTIGYKGWATEDEFVAQATLDDVKVTLGGAHASMASSVINVDEYAANAVAQYLDNPIVTVFVDDLTGGKYDLEAIEALFGYVDSDFVIDETILDIAGNYDAYKGAVGQVNHILVKLVNMLVSDSGEADLALTDGDNTNLYANLDKIGKKTDSILSATKTFFSDEEIKSIIDSFNVNDAFASSHGLNLDMILALDFSDVESMIVCGLEVVLDLIDDETPGVINDIHVAIEGLETLDAVAVAVANYAAPKALEKVNTALGTNFAWTETDAATVADGAAKDILMTNLADLAYAASEFVVAKLNKVLNNAIGEINAETGLAVSNANFELGVTKGATWEETLANLTNRVYELADGIIIACENEYTDTFDKISAVLNAVLPTEAMFSNCGNENFAVDANTVMGYLFDDALEGNFNGFLGMFEVKDDAIAGGVSVPKALINACEHIVDSIFPGTVVSANYPDAVDVQEIFTGNDSDQAIASGNMKSINNRKADLVPAALKLVRESGLLPYFAECEHLTTTAVAEVPATCTADGTSAGVKCADCGKVLSGCEAIEALGHDYGDGVVTAEPTCSKEGVKKFTCTRCGDIYTEAIEKLAHAWNSGVVTKAATCTEDGVMTYTCSVGGETRTEVIPATGHTYDGGKVTKAATCTEEGVMTYTCAVCGDTVTETIAKANHVDSDGDNSCDNCGATISSSFFAKLAAFFRKIINWFKSLFN